LKQASKQASKQEGRTKTASKFYKVTNWNNPCYKFGKSYQSWETRTLKQRKMVGQVKQGIQNWNQQATTKFCTSYQNHFKVRTRGTSDKIFQVTKLESTSYNKI
jgi:hypothetical protein